MKRIVFFCTFLLSSITFGQVTIYEWLETGINNAQRFSKDYFASSSEAVVNSISNGWYTSAEVKKFLDFEVGIVGNISFVRDEKRSFTMNANEYENISFQEGSSIQQVDNVFGTNERQVVIVSNNGGAPVTITLPDGIGVNGVSKLPTAYLQGSIGLIKSTELKARILPPVTIEGVKMISYGLGLQNEVTNWIPGWERFPVHLSGFIGYTVFNASYDLTSNSTFSGSGQEIKFKSNALVLSAIVSTKFPKYNVYGGIGYYSGKSTSKILGTYNIINGPEAGQILVDPVSVSTKTSGPKATFGMSAKFGIFKAHADYSLQNYQNIALGASFGW